MKTITAAETNRNFSELLRTVSQGEDVLIVCSGRPVARVAAVSKSCRSKARQELLQRLQGQALTGAALGSATSSMTAEVRHPPD